MLTGMLSLVCLALPQSLTLAFLTLTGMRWLAHMMTGVHALT